MPRHLYQAAEIKKGMRAWTVLVQVVEKTHPQLSRGTPPKKYRKLLLTDSLGTKVPAVIYGNDIRYFANLLCPFKRYYISNATLSFTDPTYRVSQYEFTWVLNNTTLVEELIDTIIPPLPCAFQLTRFADLFRYADTENLQNIRAVVLHAFPTREQGIESSKTRDFVVVNEEKIPMLLTLWNEFEQHEGTNIASMIATGPLIIAMRLKVTTFNSLSLTTRISSSLLLNPPLPEEMMLKDWYNANKDELKYLVDTKAYKDASRLLPPPKHEDIIDISTAQATLHQVKTAWVRGKTKLIPGQQRYWYTACANCYKSVYAEVDWKIKCPSCKEETQVQVRCRIGIMLEDDSGTLNAAIFSPDCEKLIPYSALQLKEAHESEKMVGEQLATSIEDEEIVAFIRSYDRDFQGQTSRRHSIVKAYTLQEMIEMNTAINDYEMSSLDGTTSTSELEMQQDSQQEHQALIPSANKILRATAATSTIFSRPTSSTTGVKRNLFSPEAVPKAETSINMNAVGQTDESMMTKSTSDTDLDESPSKKIRDKLKLS